MVTGGATWPRCAGNVDGRPGEELFVDVAHVTTPERISIYTFWHGGLVNAGTLPAYGDDYGVLYGVTCSVQGTRRFITDHTSTSSSEPISGCARTRCMHGRAPRSSFSPAGRPSDCAGNPRRR
jgi:hypothetical protein